jgi:hypothetical protein
MTDVGWTICYTATRASRLPAAVCDLRSEVENGRGSIWSIRP